MTEPPFEQMQPPTPPPPPPFDPAGQWETLGPAATEQVRPRGRGRTAGVLAAVVAVAAGATVSYVALSDTSAHHGASSPQAAVQTIVDDINRSDLIGVLDDLAPGERDAIVTPFTDIVNQLKRSEVLQASADPSKVTGLQVSLTGLTFTGAPLKVNDHVSVVQITGGTLHVSADARRVPFTRAFLDAAFPGGSLSGSSSQTIDIAQQVRDHGGAPVRVAAQQVDGGWYPSIFYTAADSAANHRIPAASDAVAAHGAMSAAEAVKQAVSALLTADYRTAIALLSPNELAAVHDYAGLILQHAPTTTAPVHLEDLQLTTTPDGADHAKITLRSVSLTTDSGEHVSVSIDGSCVTATAGDKTQHMCAADLVTTLESFLNSVNINTALTGAQQRAVTDLLSTAYQTGVVTEFVGGSWFVAPVRSVLEVYATILSGLQGDDAIQLATLVRTIAGH